MEHVFVRSGLLYHFTGERDGTGGRERDGPALDAGAGGSVHIIKLAGMRARVINAFTGGDVHIASAAIERDVSPGADVGRGSVVGSAISVKVVVFEFDFNIAAKRINVAR